MAERKYGLIIPNKRKLVAPIGKRKLVAHFDSDEEFDKSDDETSLDWVDSMMKKSVGNAAMRSIQKKTIQEAHKQDPTVFQYDEIYDEMKLQTEDKRKKLRGDVDKKPKYIGNILKQAAKRKLENERRVDRKVQRERDEEGDEFAHKESFVTSSFLKKAEELKVAEENERKELALEELRDVRKHKNFGVFYGHILEQTLGTDEVTIKEEENKPGVSKIKNYRKRSISQSSSSHSDDSSSDSSVLNNDQKRKPKRRTTSSSGSSSSSDTENNRDERPVINKINASEQSVILDLHSVSQSSKPLTEEERDIKLKNILKKRTVGEVFGKAVERFFQRKAMLSQ